MTLGVTLKEGEPLEEGVREGVTEPVTDALAVTLGVALVDALGVADAVGEGDGTSHTSMYFMVTSPALKRAARSGWPAIASASWRRAAGGKGAAAAPASRAACEWPASTPAHTPSSAASSRARQQAP